jgi:hypothetical protein
MKNVLVVVRFISISNDEMFTIKNSWDPCICAYKMEASAHYAQV